MHFIVARCFNNFSRVILFQPIIKLFISINELIVKYILFLESNKLFFMYVNAFLISQN